MKNMGKHILFLCTLCLGLVSCVKDDMNVVQGDGMTVFRAVYSEMPQSRTVLSGMTPYWTPGDTICIYDGVNNIFSNSLSAPAAAAEFKGKLGGNEKTYLAAAPHNPNLMFITEKKGIYGLMMPYEQTAVVNGYDPDAMVAVAYTENTQLNFRNACSLVKFKIISDDVKSVTLVANGGESLSGQFNVVYSDELSISPSQGRRPEVVLKGDFEKDSTYFISVIPASLSGGLTVYLNHSVMSFECKTPVAFKRSGMVDLGTLSLVPSESQKPEDPGDEEDDAVLSEWVLKGSFNGWTDEGALPLYVVGNNFVAFDVPASIADGFKFNSGDSWLGSGVAVSVGTWISGLYSGGEELNITFTASSADASYDIYLDKSLTAFCIVNAGEAVPVRDESDPGTGPGDIETSGVVYLKPNSNWLEAEARFAAYFFGGAYGDLWMNMTDEDADGVYECEVPVGYGNVIFVRMNPASAENNWDNKWGQTGDLLVPADDNICYALAKGSWDSGSWTTFPPAEDDSGDDSGDDGSDGDGDAVSDILYLSPWQWISDSPRFEAYFFGNGETWVTMSDPDGDGIYECTIPSGYTKVIFVRMDPAKVEHNWDSKWNQSEDLTITPGQNCFTVTSWSGGSGGNSTGVWSTK